MVLFPRIVFALGLGCSAVLAHATPIVYVLTGGQQFGTLDLSTGAFASVGPGTSAATGGLVRGPGGSLLTLGFNGDLNAINPVTGAVSVVGATGLADCSAAASPCGPMSASTLGSFGSSLYATDFANNLYAVNASTGKATLVGATGLPALSFIPHSPVPGDPDGSFYVYDETLFESRGNFYATFDTGTFDPVTFTPTATTAPGLYRIDPSTGRAGFVATLPFGLTAIAEAGGTTYGFDVATSQVLTLDVATGTTRAVTDLDPSLGSISGAVPEAASPVPEPSSFALLGSGLAAVAARVVRRRRA